MMSLLLKTPLLIVALVATRERRAAMIVNNASGDLVAIDDKADLINPGTLRRDIYDLERYAKQHGAN